MDTMQLKDLLLILVDNFANLLLFLAKAQIYVYTISTICLGWWLGSVVNNSGGGEMFE